MTELQHEKSPYLLQHAENPVSWRAWGQSAFDAAVREDKPIFLSIGYSTCHWCHVMAHESFEDEAVAEAVNRDFVPIKVDREERPDVDAVYMAACIAMNGSGGWPLTVLLTPQGKPFDETRGGFCPCSHEGEQLITRAKEVYDGAMPPGNAVAALVLSRLARLAGEERFHRAKERQFRYLSGVIRDYPAGHCFTLFALLEELWPTAELICAAGELPEELFTFLRREPRLNLTVLAKTPESGQTLAKLAPFTADYPIMASGARCYLCRGGACQSPVDSIEELERQMGRIA